ncbi:hypothetical protein MTP09_11655 [Chryseobacterium suipulveris]|uniref:Glycosyltransferase family 9 protein n=1 Tax=Chryseobacterium suipulveris TaxID=2929800 RepID=A0ABY4BS48_9FLAO|nr:hypothetical protein [Chryseobacterium suipulveris]UOE40556.1 hypothetical protein MTP09_11655 [Chryseobacterium suipulveris]
MKTEFLSHLSEIQKYLKTEQELNILHSGHIGDLIYSLPVIKELSKNYRCNLIVNIGKPAQTHAYKHVSGNLLINEKLYSKLLPLLQKVSYLNNIEVYKNQKIHLNFDLFREFPFELNFITVRWYSHLTGVFPDFTKPALQVEPHPVIKDKVVIIRSFRVRNSFVNYSFLKKYDNLLFVGLPDEFEDLKRTVPNLEYYDAKDFYELAQIIKSSKFYLGNQSFGFALAETMKVPRLLEAYSDFPVVHPIGENAYDFYFQEHFELLFDKLYNS